MKKNKKIIITSEEAGGRLDQVVTAKFTELTRSQLAKLIKAGQILVNEKPAKPHYFVHEGDEITVLTLEVTPETVYSRPVVDLMDKVEILGETEDYVVVNKPAGMIVHYPPDKDNIKPMERNPSLADWLVKNYPQAKTVGDDLSRPGIVHRLDKSVSGVMVLALNQKSFASLKRQFKARKITKKYVALVFGIVIADEDILEFPLVRSTSGKKMAAKPIGSEEGKEAITEFKVAKRYINYTLLDINLKTGRTHQIRAHMAAYGHSIVGDKVYSTAKTRVANQKLNLGRLFLMSRLLAFKDLQGVRVEFEIELPKELKHVLAKVK